MLLGLCCCRPRSRKWTGCLRSSQSWKTKPCTTEARWKVGARFADTCLHNCKLASWVCQGPLRGASRHSTFVESTAEAGSLDCSQIASYPMPSILCGMGESYRSSSPARQTEQQYQSATLPYGTRVQEGVLAPFLVNQVAHAFSWPLCGSYATFLCSNCSHVAAVMSEVKQQVDPLWPRHREDVGKQQEL